jgi:LPS export ABC transporter protein LptC
MRYFLILALVVAGACRDGATTPSAAAAEQELAADQIMYDVRHNMTNAGIRRAVLHGDTAFLRDGGAKIDIVGVRMHFFDENGRESGDLTSRTGTYQLRAGNMVAEGGAVLRTFGAQGEQRSIETEQLHFDVNGDRLWSDVPVVMREGTQIVRGTSFTSDGRFQNVRVTRAQTQGTPSESRPGGISF